MEDFAGEVALETAHDLIFRFAFGEAPRHVVTGGLVAAQPHDQDDMQRPVGITVAAAVESVSDGFAAGGLQRADSAEFSEGAVAGDPIVVVADRCQQGGGGVEAKTVDGAQLRCGGSSDGVDVCLSRVASTSGCSQRAASDLIATVMALVVLLGVWNSDNCLHLG